MVKERICFLLHLEVSSFKATIYNAFIHDQADEEEGEDCFPNAPANSNGLYIEGEVNTVRY